MAIFVCVFLSRANHLHGVAPPCRNLGMARCLVLWQALAMDRCAGTCAKLHVASASVSLLAVLGTGLAWDLFAHAARALRAVLHVCVQADDLTAQCACLRGCRHPMR